MMKAIVTDGPDRSAMAAAVRTKMPAPMTAPMPSATRAPAPSVRFRVISPPSCSVSRRSIDLVRNSEPGTSGSSSPAGYQKADQTRQTEKAETTEEGNETRRLYGEYL